MFLQRDFFLRFPGVVGVGAGAAVAAVAPRFPTIATLSSALLGLHRVLDVTLNSCNTTSGQ